MTKQTEKQTVAISADVRAILTPMVKAIHENEALRDKAEGGILSALTQYAGKLGKYKNTDARHAEVVAFLKADYLAQGKEEASARSLASGRALIVLALANGFTIPEGITKEGDAKAAIAKAASEGKLMTFYTPSGKGRKAKPEEKPGKVSELTELVKKVDGGDIVAMLSHGQQIAAFLKLAEVLGVKLSPKQAEKVEAEAK